MFIKVRSHIHDTQSPFLSSGQARPSPCPVSRVIRIERPPYHRACGGLTEPPPGVAVGEVEAGPSGRRHLLTPATRLVAGSIQCLLLSSTSFPSSAMVRLGRGGYTSTKPNQSIIRHLITCNVTGISEWRDYLVPVDRVLVLRPLIQRV